MLLCSVVLLRLLMLLVLVRLVVRFFSNFWLQGILFLQF
jgi:hypothetical protein